MERRRPRANAWNFEAAVRIGMMLSFGLLFWWISHPRFEVGPAQGALWAQLLDFAFPMGFSFLCFGFLVPLLMANRT